MRHTLTIIAFFGLQFLYCQNKTKENLIEYLPSLEPTVTLLANIFIPSFQKMTVDTPKIAIKRKGDVWIEIYYRYRDKTNTSKDTCYISTFTHSRRQHFENAGMNAEQIGKVYELPCYNSDENCNFIISTTEIHYVRFRIGQKTKTYKLMVTE